MKYEEKIRDTLSKPGDDYTVQMESRIENMPC